MRHVRMKIIEGVILICLELAYQYLWLAEEVSDRADVRTRQAKPAVELSLSSYAV
jgi:hypothetical protein